MKSRHAKILACDKIPAATGHALTTMSTMPPDPNALTFLPDRHARTEGIDHACHLVTCDPWIIETGPMSLFHKRITMTDAAGLYFDASHVRPRLRDLACDDLEWRAWMIELNRSHLCHCASPLFRFSIPRCTHNRIQKD